MKASHLRFFVLVVWGLVIVLGGLFLIWALNSGMLQYVFSNTGRASAANLTSEVTLLPTLPSLTPTFSASTVTPRPVTPSPIPPTRTPITPIPLPGVNPNQVSADIDPITGLKVADPSLLNRRPVSVKITNFPRSVRNYQYGLTKADVVYEYYIEDGLTRFIGVFYGQDASMAGPVRSGRYFDEHIMRMYHASLVFASADLRVRNYLLNSPGLYYLLFMPRDDNCPPLCRDKAIQGFDNYFVNTAGVGPMLRDNSRQNLRPTFTYGLLPDWSGTAITKIFNHYSSYCYNDWEYDPTKNLYLRYSDAVDALNGQAEVYTPLIDKLTNQQVTANNVVELVVPHLFHNQFDRADQVFDIKLIGSGDAYVFRDGRMIKGRWVRDKIDQQIELVDQAGNPVGLNPGVTFYEVTDPEGTMKQEDKTMEFFFFIPPRYFTPTPTATKFKPTETPRPPSPTPRHNH